MNAIRTSATALLAMLAWTLVAQAQLPPSKIIEASVETTGNAVHFPAASSGRIIVQGCPECRDQSLQLDAASSYYINGQRVTLAQITSAARGGADRSLTIHFRLKDKIVTRVELTLPAS